MPEWHCSNGSVFFFFGSLFLFASQQKEKVNKDYIYPMFIVKLNYGYCIK